VGTYDSNHSSRPTRKEVPTASDRTKGEGGRRGASFCRPWRDALRGRRTLLRAQERDNTFPKLTILFMKKGRKMKATTSR